MSFNNFDFTQLLTPIKPAIFFQEYWEKQPLILSRKDSCYYSDLFSVQDFDSILNFTKLQPPAIKVVKSHRELLPGKFLKPDHSLDLNQVYKLYEQGSTLILNGVQQLWKPLATLCHNLQKELNYSTFINTYFSPKNAKGLPPHFDSHDVLILQIEGTKHWQIYEPFQSIPLLSETDTVIPENKLDKPINEFDLQPGDLLYLPRGFIHQAKTTKWRSLHLTIAIYPAQWFDLMVKALLGLSMRDERFRKALPVGFLDYNQVKEELEKQFQEIAQIFCQEARIEEAFSLQAQDFLHQNSTLPQEGYFSKLNELDNININTIIAKRPELKCSILDQGSSVSIQFSDKTVPCFIQMKPALNFIVETDQFSVQCIPGKLTDEGKISLVRRLVEAGLLRVV